MNHISLTTAFGLLLLLAQTAGGFMKHNDIPSTSDIAHGLRSYAEVYGTEYEFELLQEAFQRIANGTLEGFDASVDPKRFGINHCEDDCYRNVTQLITSKGYGCEEHYTVTSDGYVLALQRVLPKSGVPNNTSKVVLLQHGFLDSATTWVINQASNSLGFMLVDAGFDVWLLNSRGNKYSHTNIHHNDNGRKFWQFSWDEMAKIDLPTFVDYVTLVTNVSKVHYVGHSQGTLIGFTGFSQNQALADKIEHFYALAPIAIMGDAKGPIKFLARFHKLVYKFLSTLGIDEVLPNGKIEQEVGKTVCDISPLTCELVTFFICGPNPVGFNKTRTPVYYTHFPAGTSLRNMDHWAQLIFENKTQMYDFGRRGNKDHYGQKDAPVYNITGLTVPVSLFYGGHDWLADPADVETLKQTIPNAIKYSNMLSRFEHLDFVWGITADKLVYKTIIKQIKNGVK